ncbi:MAG: tRNA (adenosine(37)-N6)-threonylcarbamoyltransferase complex transferase subunit TsaD [Candidatus Nealsonbacteria bacterium]|nr:tRNA (adenosine(37)-N6)-threonylcarbamoyltransferase complex transferase subunit TsaD [Candidatus Nealsonbacteria bacterium]
MAAKNITILGIDTSCDDTSVALVKIQDTKYKILSNVISSQVKLHAKYGGVFPSLAKREHQKNLPAVFKEVLEEAGLLTLGGSTSREISREVEPLKIDFIAVTAGPGLEPCLWQGINFAKEIAKKYKKPLIPVNHIEAHILANLIVRSRTPLKIEWSPTPHNLPAVALVVSGGHTQLILIRKIGQYKLIGETRDDAAGECFDKVARILGLGYPGGPIISQLAAKVAGEQFSREGELFSVKLPRPMMYTKDYDFSFSGLKTAVLYRVKQGNYDKIEMCHEVQQSIIDVLIHKTIKAAKDFGVKSIILGGGVAANEELRRQFYLNLKSKILNLNFLVPPKNLCTDNAAMVATAAFFHRAEKVKDIKADANLRI